MKVVLFTLNGSWSHSSLALRCLRRPLEEAGFEVRLLEYTLRDRDAHILEALYAEQAEIYSFSCYIWNLRPMLSLAQSLHALLPKAKIVLGGPEVSYGVARFSDLPWIDAIVCGEGEAAFPALCQKIRAGESFEPIWQGGTPDVMGNEGILYRDGETTGSILYYESSRGCPFSCAYCLSSATHGVRMKSVEQTLADMEAFETLRIPCKVIKFVDRTFNANAERANRIWQGLLEDRFTGQYHFEVCASLLNEESFAILSQFPKGKIQLEFGLQSTNPKTLEATSRHIRAEQVIAAVGRIHAMGNIHVHLDLIAGLPYEDYASFARSFDDAYGCCDLLQLGFLKLLYGTPLRENMADYGYVCLPDPPYTVLQSKWITYPQMQRLSRIAEVLERYLESGRFSHTLFYLTPRMPSPFAFWEGLSLFLEQNDPRPLQKISQPDVFWYLLQYARTSVPGVDERTLKEMLCADFRQSENKHPPKRLTREEA
ncbi:MAG: B12-binding domain-containing radical SAM protein [Clostridia bacterium]|nr:B12-binding domain-containing radical SAM protein [Clostridia bacterium]